MSAVMLAQIERHHHQPSRGTLMRRFRTVLAAALLGVASGFATLALAGAPAHATAPDCKTVTTDFASRPDNGHGTGGPAELSGYWADVTGTRTVTICVDPQETLAEVAVPGQHFKATVVDSGTFVTKGGDKLSPNHGAKLVAGVQGTWNGGFTASFIAPAPSAPGVWPYFDASALAGKTLTGMAARTPGHDQWVRSMWSKDAELTGDFIIKYHWLYKACNEAWLETSGNDDGQGTGAGDITGLSRIPCYGNPSFTPKCDGTVIVLLTNAAPAKTSLAAYRVSGVTEHGGNVLVAGGKPGQVAVAATPDAKGVVTVTYGFGAKKTVKTFTWVKPKDCESPSGSPSPSGSAPVVGLPVTGAPTTAVAVGGGALLLTGGVLLFALRRRRIRFEA